MNEQQARPEVVSIGVTHKGNSVVRVRMPNGAQVDVETNLVSFAKLAALGVRVYNEGSR